MVEGSVLIKKKVLRQTKLFKFRQAFNNIAMGAVSFRNTYNSLYSLSNFKMGNYNILVSYNSRNVISMSITVKN